jgi:hypothetical protein
MTSYNPFTPVEERCRSKTSRISALKGIEFYNISGKKHFCLLLVSFSNGYHGVTPGCKHSRVSYESGYGTAVRFLESVDISLCHNVQTDSEAHRACLYTLNSRNLSLGVTRMKPEADNSPLRSELFVHREISGSQGDEYEDNYF